jgi:hypothetical protein
LTKRAEDLAKRIVSCLANATHKTYDRSTHHTAQQLKSWRDGRFRSWWYGVMAVVWPPFSVAETGVWECDTSTRIVCI